METYDLRYFSTPEGNEVLRSKRYGENIVPFGTYYDEGERYERLISRLKSDIIPLLRLIEALIIEKYEIRPYWISYTGHTDHDKFVSLNLIDFEKHCMNYLHRYSPDHFNVCLNIDFQKEITYWGAQISIYLDNIQLQDEGATEDYSVWYLCMHIDEEYFCETLDENYSSTMISGIVKCVMDLIQSDYNISNSTSEAGLSEEHENSNNIFDIKDQIESIDQQSFTGANHREIALAYIEQVHQAAVDLGITQQAIADKIGFTRENVNRMLNGNNIPRFDNFLKLCAAIGLQLKLDNQQNQK